MSRGHSFGDIEHHQAKMQIKERFNKVLTDLQKTVEQNGYAVQTVQRFRGCLENPENSDVSRLPFYSDMPFAMSRNKIKCVLSLVSFAIQRYWQFCTGNQLVKDSLDVYLNWLENIIVKGLKAFKIRKSKSPRGYYLEEIK